MAKFLDGSGLLYLWQKIQLAFVEKEAGKGLSANDFSNTYKGYVDDNRLAINGATASPTNGSTNLFTAGGAYTELAKKIDVTSKGQANGVASLDAGGKVPSSQLPSYVDDVVEGYYDATLDKFYTSAAKTTEIAGEAGKIYIDLTDNINTTYRYGGSVFVAISSGDISALTNLEIDEALTPPTNTEEPGTGD